MQTLQFSELLEQSKKEIKIADHLLHVTYAMVSEAKILLAVAGHVVNSARFSLEALLEFEKHWKRLDAYHPNFALEISIFRNKEIEKRYSFDPKFYRLLQKLLEIHRFDKEALVRFKRGDKYILANGGYNLSVLDLESLKRYSGLTKKFVENITNIIQNVKT